MSVAYEADGLALTRKTGSSKIASKLWIALVQAALLAIAVPGALALGPFLG